MSKRGKGKSKQVVEAVVVAEEIKKEEIITKTHLSSDEDVDDSFEISKYGYKLLFKLIYDGSTGLVARYLKALNTYGETIYIYLDKEGHISTDGICQRAVRSESASQSFDVLLDQDMKDMFYELSFDLYGVAVEHKNNLSILTRRTDKPQDFESRHMEVSFESSYLTFYPVIRLSEIEEASTAALKAGSESFRRIRNKLLGRATKESMSNHLKVAEYHDRSAEFIRRASEATVNLSRVIKGLEDTCQSLQNKQNSYGLSAKDEDKYELAIYNLIHRHKLFEKLLRYYQNFSKFNINHAEEIRNLTAQLDKDFLGIDRIRYPGEITD